MVHGNTSQRQKIDANDLCLIGRRLVVCLCLMALYRSSFECMKKIIVNIYDICMHCDLITQNHTGGSPTAVNIISGVAQSEIIIDHIDL